MLKFVDLFAGLGGFHVALNKLGHQCVFASEIDESLRCLYEQNFGIYPHGDIRDSWASVPDHDILCAGFPCQPFSKAGAQKGFKCSLSGDLFSYLIRIIERKHPTNVILENVPNIMRHDRGNTWKRIKSSLEERGYQVDQRLLSPHMFKIPQIRPRAIIVARKNSLGSFVWPETDTDNIPLHLNSIIELKPVDAKPLPEAFLRYLEAWDDFLKRIPKDVKIPSFPIWAMEFGATYPYHVPPAILKKSELDNFCGAFGVPLAGHLKEDQIKLLPPYAQGNTAFPKWKLNFIDQNRKFYESCRLQLSDWLPKISSFAPSFQKLEWNWQAGDRSIWDKVIQFRASGIRVKNPATAPSLVALTTSQIPVIAWQKRYMTVKECARLQSLDTLSHLPKTKSRAFRALGNAVNAHVVALVAGSLVNQHSKYENLAFEARSLQHPHERAHVKYDSI